jgi:predicted nuclease with TOPRIM domain
MPDNLFEYFNQAMYASLAGLFVGVVIKGASKFFDSKKEKLDEHVTLRRELREELDKVKKEVYLLQKELDEWKQKYYTQVELTNQLKMDVIRLNDELEEYKRTGSFPSADDALADGWINPDDYTR